ncbi:MAG: helix-turn-helix domain-containing protein [Brevinematales bacterium]|nr:helix-turn-helix domain-containing protein [Brevinematales bacterium]
MKFGEYLKLIRLENEITLRRLAKTTGIDAAYLSRVERSVSPAPQKADILNKLIEALKVSGEQETKFRDLSAAENGEYPNDIKNELKENRAIPILLRTINNKKLTDQEIKDLTELINREY